MRDDTVSRAQFGSCIPPLWQIRIQDMLRKFNDSILISVQKAEQVTDAEARKRVAALDAETALQRKTE